MGSAIERSISFIPHSTCNNNTIPAAILWIPNFCGADTDKCICACLELELLYSDSTMETPYRLSNRNFYPDSAYRPGLVLPIVAIELCIVQKAGDRYRKS